MYKRQVLITYCTKGERWPGTEVHLTATEGEWSGLGAGSGRLRQRRLTVHTQGRGKAARPRSATLWLPAAGGGVDVAEPGDSVRQFPAIAG